MNITGTIISPNCDIQLISNFRVVQLTEIYNKAMNYTFIILMISIAQVILISHQIQYSVSSATAHSKVSIACIAMHTLLGSSLS